MQKDMELALFIRNARKGKNLTIARAAGLAGVSWRHWNEMERGANITVGILRRVAAVLDLTRIPMGGNVELVRERPAIEAGALLEIAESLASRIQGCNTDIDRLRDVAVTAMVGANPLLDTEAVRRLFEKHANVDDERAGALANAALRLARDAGIPVPAAPVPAAQNRAVKKRRKA